MVKTEEEKKFVQENNHCYSCKG